MRKFDILVIDIQDVGLRFYTYYITMCRLMDACAEYNQKGIIAGPSQSERTLCRRTDTGHEIQIQGGLVAYSHCTWNDTGRTGINGKRRTLVTGLTQMRPYRHTLQELYAPDKIITHSPLSQPAEHEAVYLYPATCFLRQLPSVWAEELHSPFQVYGHPNMTGYDYSFTPKVFPAQKSAPTEQAMPWRKPQ